MSASAKITLSGLFSPYLAGKMISGAGLVGYHQAFLVNGLVLLVGGLSAFFLLRPREGRLPGKETAIPQTKQAPA